MGYYLPKVKMKTAWSVDKVRTLTKILVGDHWAFERGK